MSDFVDKHYKAIMYILFIVLIFIAGVFVERHIFNGNAPDIKSLTHDGIKKENSVLNIHGDGQTQRETQFVYVPKETVTHYVTDSSGRQQLITEREKTDFQASIGKPDFNVKVNDKEMKFTKSSDEKYMFEKNKLVMTQTDKVDFNVHVDPIIEDHTKYMGVGIGVTSKGQPAYIVNIPVDKKHNVDAWGYKDPDKYAAGIEIRF